MSGGLITFLAVLALLLIVRMFFMAGSRRGMDAGSAEALRRVRALQSRLPDRVRTMPKCAACRGLGYVPDAEARTVNLCGDCQGTGRAGAARQLC